MSFNDLFKKINFSKLKNRKIIAGISLSVILILTTFSVIQYNSTKNEIKKELEEALFTIDKVDIIDGLENSLIVEFRLLISNYNFDASSKLIDVESIKLDFFNESEFIGSSSFEPTNEELKPVQFIQTSIPVSDSTKESDVNGFLSNILTGRNFNLDFKATVKFTTVKIFGDELLFNNSVKFLISGQEVTLELETVDIINLEDEFTNVTFILFNPFSSTIGLRGVINAYFGKTNIGEILLSETAFLVPGNNQVVAKLFPVNSLKNLVDQLFNLFDEPFMLHTDLVLIIGDLNLGISTSFPVRSSNTNVFDLLVEDVYGLDIDQANLEFSVQVDFLITNYLPINLNVSGIKMNVSTLDGSQIGEVEWTAISIISLQSSQPVIVRNVTISFSDISLVLILKLAVDQAIKITNGIVILDFLGENYQFDFSIEKIDL